MRQDSNGESIEVSVTDYSSATTGWRTTATVMKSMTEEWSVSFNI